jgi:uncharacterized protein (DUF1800 family)
MAVDSKPVAGWEPYEPSEAAPWNRERVVHLHRRAAFAARWSEIERDLKDGPKAAIDRLISGKARADASSPDFEQMARIIGDAAQASNDAGRLKAWWFYRMLFSPDPLGERLALLWHNHFATSNRKVQDLVYMREQNELLRKHARGPFGGLLRTVVKQPAMLVWLDADSNRAGHANENLARELMELFTLGIGHYTEADVQSAAGALTGWTIADKAYRFNSNRHDDHELSVLGHRGRMSGDDLLDVLIENSATARRIVWRLSTMFFGEGAVSDSALDALAAEFRDRKLDINWAVEMMVRSQRFFAEENIGTRILGPTEFIVGTLHALEQCQPPPSTVLLAEWSTRMGQDLFYPPNVGGWAEGRSWLSSRAVIARANFVSALVEGQIWTSGQKPDFERLAGGIAEDANINQSVERFAELIFVRPPSNAVAAAVAAAKDKDDRGKLPSAVASLLTNPEAQLA